MTTSGWWAAGNNWLCKKAEEHFNQWVESKAGAKWRKRRKGSPNSYGYSQPQWMFDAREALGKNDEETFKAIKLVNL